MRYVAYGGMVAIFFVAAFLQNSFLNIFPALTAPLLLLFTFFYTIVFFEKEKKYGVVLFYAVVASMLTDVVNADYFGSSLIIFLVVGLGMMKLKEYIQEQQEAHPFIFFIPLFVAVFIFYLGSSALILYRFQWESALLHLNQFAILPMLLFNSASAVIFFFIVRPLRKFYVQKV